MSSTLFFRQTPRVKEIGSCKLPLKGIFAEHFYGHDGTLGGGMVTIDTSELSWLKGLKAGLGIGEDAVLVDKIINILTIGGTVDMWFN